MKDQLLTNWHFVRILRLAAGIWIGMTAIYSRDALLGLIGTFLLWQAVSNTGCCGTASCHVPEIKDNPMQSKEISFEEVKK